MPSNRHLFVIALVSLDEVSFLVVEALCESNCVTSHFIMKTYGMDLFVKFIRIASTFCGATMMYEFLVIKDMDVCIYLCRGRSDAPISKKQ
jgi:hypothetical protein